MKSTTSTTITLLAQLSVDAKEYVYPSDNNAGKTIQEKHAIINARAAHWNECVILYVYELIVTAT